MVVALCSGMSANDIVLETLAEIKSTSRYSAALWISDVREACELIDVDTGHNVGLTPAQVDAALVSLWQDGLVELARADLPQGVVDKVEASELQLLNETFHYVGLK